MTIHEIDTVRDVAALADELRDRGLLDTPDVVVTYLLRFGDGAAVVSAEQAAAADGWRTSVFTAAGGCVLRLSRDGLLSIDRLGRDQTTLREFALAHRGHLIGFAAEAVDAPTLWERTAQLVTDAEGSAAHANVAHLPAQPVVATVGDETATYGSTG